MRTPEWKQIYTTELIDIYRDGYRGVWDALVSAVSRKPRKTIKGTITMSLWVKAEHEVKMKLCGLQAEIGEEKAWSMTPQAMSEKGE